MQYSVFACFWLSVPVQLVSWNNWLRNDLLCVEWDVNPTTLTHLKLSVQIPCGRGSVFLWWCCDVRCTSGFMDDVTFGRSGPYGNLWKAETLTYYH